MGVPAKDVSGKPDRGFESLPLRNDLRAWMGTMRSGSRFEKKDGFESKREVPVQQNGSREQG